ncbi:MAG: MgtC/SapB family protein [Lysobacter sp.]|nr:MgtC/SapB family protein [Lysobacter sp.]MDQ3270085.1 MgtC/SapB family protein [Pseudomonadota bacterium]
MQEFLDYLTPFLTLLGAVALAFPIGWNRERHGDTMGVRTFPLVAVGSCAYVLIAEQFIGPEHSPDAMARVLQGLMTGIGFVGGGAILKHDDRVSGTATAASIWVVGAIGAAVGLGYWNHAISLAIMNFLVVTVFAKFKERSDRK